MRFQYSLIINISLIDWFLTLVFGIQIGMNERKKIHEQVFRKNSCLGKWIILGAKMAYPHNSGLALRFFCTVKGVNRQMKKILFFPKKIFVGQMDYLVTKRAHPHNSGSTVKIVLQFCTMKKAKRDIDIILTVFLKKNLIQGSFVILAQNWYITLTF